MEREDNIQLNHKKPSQYIRSDRKPADTRPVLKVIARIQTDLPTKFGIPRQSGMVEALKGRIIFEPEYRNMDAFRGLEGFSHIWLIWEFSEAVRDTWSPMVKPPRLGGNQRMGVFATRSPFRPNHIGLSSVRLEKIEEDSQLGPVLYISGADLMDGTPIYDIKPYLPYTDSHPEAQAGFAQPVPGNELEVIFPEHWKEILPREHHDAVAGLLACDPRPSYQNDPERIYGVEFAGYNIRFFIDQKKLTICSVEQLD